MTKCLIKMLSILKDKFMQYKNGDSIHDYCVCCEVAKDLFGLTDEQIDEYESKWNDEFYGRQGRRCLKWHLAIT